ncbi:hypothetical protein [Xenorhabdus bovienii]|uniref:hypothetical protein n=1 Tax=Xenorhabdus bovienii TaxID=40576 RepID=UPI0023B220EC|nr:hypothetical protein [Xenorhabdus bovienii]MDE9456097.1 hypothetical protein [Xenorhabdus bovienii]MDE9553579.1 hypothetical protein [Xenorhabdus bovienii]
MSRFPENSIIVEDISTNTLNIMVTKNGDMLVNKMKLLGFFLMNDEIREYYKDDDRYYIDPFANFMKLSVDTEEEKIKIIILLIKEEALFSCGRNWSPEEVMDYYKKDKKLISEKYKTIHWYGSEKYYIREIE